MNEVGAFIGYAVGVLGLVLSISNFVYNKTKDAKKEVKECSIDTTTVIVKLENIQSTMNRLIETMSSMQTKFENFDHRLTVVETQLKLGAVDLKNLNL